MDEKFRAEKDKRFYEVVKYLKIKYNIKSDTKFSESINEDRQSIADIKAGKKSVSDIIITKLCNQYKEINIDFIRDGGENPMILIDPIDLNDSNAELATERIIRVRVPVVPLDATASFITRIDGSYKIEDLDFEFDTVERMPGIRYSNLTVIFRVVGNSMWPHFKNTSKWLCTWVDASNWLYTEGAHVISLNGGSLLLKKITQGDKGVLHLKSDNPEYGERTIELSEILAIWKVQYCTYAPVD